MSRYTRKDLQDDVAHVNEMLQKRGIKRAYRASGRNGCTAVDFQRGADVGSPCYPGFLSAGRPSELIDKVWADVGKDLVYGLTEIKEQS